MHFRYRFAATALATMVVAAIGCAVVAPCAIAGVVTPKSGGSPNADHISTLYTVLLVLAAIIFVGVEGLLIWFIFKYRARKGAVAAQVHGNTQLELSWTIGAAVLLVIIAAVTFFMLPKITTPAASDIDINGNAVSPSVQIASLDQPKVPKGASLRIRVNGQQYIWRYQYPGTQKVFSYEEMVVPVGMTVLLDITSSDVAHSWWIPALGGKFDAIPGLVNHTWFKALKPGTYVGQCGELCGRNHANMTARVRAVPFPEYRRWHERQAFDIQQAELLGAKQRKQYTLTKLESD